MNELSWSWIALALTVPPLVAGPIAVLIWRQGQPILGNLAGTAVIFGAAVGLILRERVDIERVTQACLDRGVVCWPDPSAFTRFAIYAFIALAEVMALFLLSLRVEEKLRRRGYAPEWR